MPGQAVGTVGGVNARELGVEQQLPGRAELGDEGHGAPADEQVAVAGGLRVPLLCGQQALGLLNRLHQGGHLGRQVQMHGDHPAVGKQPGAAAGLVVEQRVLVVPDGLRVVLIGEDLARPVEDLPGRGFEPERAVLAAEYPDDVPGAQVHLVHRPGEAGADQQVSVGVQVDGVDVEPVPGGGGRRGPRLLAVLVGDVVCGVPLEEHLAGADVDLLHDAVDDLLVGGAADGGQVRGPDGVGDDQRRVPGRDEEFLAVGRVAVAAFDLSDPLVAVVVEVVGPARNGTQVGRTLPPGEHRLALVRLRAEVGGQFVCRNAMEPDHLAGVADDLGAAHAAPGRSDEDIAVAVISALLQHNDRGRLCADRRAGGHGGARCPGQGDDRGDSGGGPRAWRIVPPRTRNPARDAIVSHRAAPPFRQSPSR